MQVRSVKDKRVDLAKLAFVFGLFGFPFAVASAKPVVKSAFVEE